MIPDRTITSDLERISELAADFIGTEYGLYLMKKLKELHFSTHDEAEKAEGLEAKAIKVVEATAYRNVINLIMGTAELKAGGFFEAERQAEQDIRDAAGISP